MPERVAFIGLGALGEILATNLVERGHEVHGFRREMRRAGKFLAAGGKRAASPAAAAAGTSLVLQCLPSPDALDAVLNGEEGVVRALEPGAVVVELGSYPVEVKLGHRDALAARGITLLDGEVSGSPPMAAGRQGVTFLAGDEAAAERATPVLRDMIDQCVYLGEFGAASRMKLLANILVAVHNAAAAEVLALARRVDIDPGLALDVLSKGAGFSAVLGYKGPLMVERRWHPAAGSHRTLEKYVDLANRMAEETSAATPMLDAATALYRRAMADGRGEEDVASLIEVVEETPRR